MATTIKWSFQESPSAACDIKQEFDEGPIFISSKDKVVFITGANRGIGLGLARLYSQRPNHVVIGTTRRIEAATELKGLGNNVYTQKMDVTSDESVESAVNELLKQKSMRVDLLINNAGYYSLAKDLEKETSDQLLRAFDINAVGPFRVTKAMRSLLNRSENAKVINITSRMGSIADCSGKYYGYRASKAAQNMFTKCLSVDLAPIPVIAFHPGLVDTKMARDGEFDASKTPDEAAEIYVNMIDTFDESHTGKFISHDGGKILPW